MRATFDETVVFHKAIEDGGLGLKKVLDYIGTVY